MESNKDCVVNYAGVCIHQMELQKETEKRTIIVSEMKSTINDIEKLLEIKNHTIKNCETLIYRLRENSFNTRESCYKEIKDLTDSNISLKLENEDLKEKLLLNGQKYRNSKHFYFYGFVIGFVICQIINIFLNGSV